MSVAEPTQHVGELGDMASAEDQAYSMRQTDDHITAIAIDFQHGRCGVAVFVEEEHQLLLCEDIPCDFAFDDRDYGQVCPARSLDDGAVEGLGHGNHPSDDGVDTGRAPAFAHASRGLIESCEQHFTITSVSRRRCDSNSAGLLLMSPFIC